MDARARPFWETTALAAMTRSQWEALCDGCARCCLHKLQDRENGRIYFTMIACRLLDRQTCRCRDYTQRTAQVPECIVLTADNVHACDWLPATCAYRKLAAGEPLDSWHPLISGNRESVRRAGVSIQGMTLSEDDIHADDWPRMILGVAPPL
jgi:uncharacterized cysteine cluster protein YcgN (CxxCxxCC family)